MNTTTDTREFYPKIDRLMAMDIIDGIIEDATPFQRLAAWDHIVHHRLHFHLQGRIGRQAVHMIENRMVSDTEHRGFCKINLNCDVEIVDALPFVPENEFCEWFSSKFFDFKSHSPIPYVACAQLIDDGEYFLKHHSEPISSYVDLGPDGVLIGCSEYWVGYKHKGLKVYQELSEDDTQREYICLDNVIIYLDTLEKKELS